MFSIKDLIGYAIVMLVGIWAALCASLYQQGQVLEQLKRIAK